jgi:hypothetical protein
MLVMLEKRLRPPLNLWASVSSVVALVVSPLMA